MNAPTVAANLRPSDPEIHLEFIDGEFFALGKPAAFLGRIGERGEHTLGRYGIAALNHESTVRDRSLFHIAS